MTFPKKGLRPITVDGETYRYKISSKISHVALLAGKDAENGQLVEVAIETDLGKYWLEFPNVDGFNLKVATPKLVQSIIKQALHLGWRPDLKGKTLKFNLKLAEEIITRA